jgi:glycosyltransferase involved in cell wall biosynthesis
VQEASMLLVLSQYFRCVPNFFQIIKKIPNPNIYILKMKIVYISTSYIPSRAANSIHVMKMCQALVKNGHEVVLISWDRKGFLEPDIDDIFAFYGVEKCFELVKINCLSILGSYYLYNLLSAIKVHQINPDLVYSREIFGCLISAKTGFSVIYESHSTLKPGNIREWAFRQLLKSSKLKFLVVITNALKEYYKNNYSFPETKMIVVPDGADIVSEKSKSFILPNKNKKMQIGYVGHLYSGRGIDIIISMTKTFSQADFHLVGGLEKDIQFWKKEALGLKNIFFHGFVSPSEAEKYRAAFDILISPYQENVSTCGGKNTLDWMSPLKIFEYMAAGKPIICSDLSVLREILENEKNALLCPPDDLNAWKNALKRLMCDPELRNRLGEVAKKEFIEKYTWRARAKRLLSL